MTAASRTCRASAVECSDRAVDGTCRSPFLSGSHHAVGGLRTLRHLLSHHSHGRAHARACVKCEESDTRVKRTILTFCAIAMLALAALPGGTVAQQKTLKEQLVGTWIFVSSTTKNPDGSPLW